MQPILTDLKSTQAAPTIRSFDISRFFEKPTTPTRGDFFVSYRLWTKLPMIVGRNLTTLALSEPKSALLGVLPLLQDYVVPQLQHNGIRVHLDTQSPYLNHAEIVISDASDTPLLMGNTTEQDLFLDIVTMLQKHLRLTVDDMYSAMQKLGGGGVHKLVYGLANDMALNNLNTGFLSCRTSTLFVHLMPTQSGSGYEICVSTPVKNCDLGKLMAAIIVETVRGNHRLQDSATFIVRPQVVAMPDVTPLSSYDEGSRGKLRWWVARQLYRTNVSMTLDIAASSKLVTHGSLSIGTQSARDTSNIIVPHNSNHNLYKTASMLQYANSKHMKNVPQLVLSGSFLSFDVLSLVSLGHELAPSHFMNEAYTKSMHEILSVAHELGIMINWFDEHSFFLFITENGTPSVTFLGFGYAKLYRHVPLVAREKEHQLLDQYVEGRVGSI